MLGKLRLIKYAYAKARSASKRKRRIRYVIVPTSQKTYYGLLMSLDKIS
jgi:hypothetical protein